MRYTTTESLLFLFEIFSYLQNCDMLFIYNVVWGSLRRDQGRMHTIIHAIESQRLNFTEVFTRVDTCSISSTISQVWVIATVKIGREEILCLYLLSDLSPWYNRLNKNEWTVSLHDRNRELLMLEKMLQAEYPTTCCSSNVCVEELPSMSFHQNKIVYHVEVLNYNLAKNINWCLQLIHDPYPYPIKTTDLDGLFGTLLVPMTTCGLIAWFLTFLLE